MNKELLFIGDSLIAYQEWQPLFTDSICHNLGVPGQTVNELVASLPAITEQYPTAQACIIMIGINNLVTADFTLLSGYQQILDIFAEQLPATKLFVTSLLPLQLPWLAPDAASRLNEGLQSMAEASSACYVDIYTPFKDAGATPFLEDGVHLSSKGYELWYDVLAPLLKKLPINN